MRQNQDVHFTFLLSSYYVKNSIEIWGFAFLLVTIAFVFNRTYIDKFNYTFIAWFIVALLFWSANETNHQARFTIQFTPAVYFLAILTIENIAKMDVYNLANTFVFHPQYVRKTIQIGISKIKILFIRFSKSPFKDKSVTDIVIVTDIEEARKLLALGWEYQTSYSASMDNIPHFVLRKEKITN